MYARICAILLSPSHSCAVLILSVLGTIFFGIAAVTEAAAVGAAVAAGRARTAPAVIDPSPGAPNRMGYQGLVAGSTFQPPRGLWGRLQGALMDKLSPGLLAQSFVVPLMSDHRILTQVGGHAADVIRLLPPLMIGRKEVDRFLGAFAAVLEAAKKFPGPIWEIGSRLAAHAIKGR